MSRKPLLAALGAVVVLAVGFSLGVNYGSASQPPPVGPPAAQSPPTGSSQTPAPPAQATPQAVAPVAPAKPDLELAPPFFEPSEFDLGVQPWNAEAPFAAEFVNRSERRLKIHNVESTCGCILADLNRLHGMEFAPGEATLIEGSIRVGLHSGEHEKELRVLLSSGEIQTLTIRYTAFATYDYKPTGLNFGQVDLDLEDESNEVTRRIIFTSDTARLTETPTTDSPWLAASYHERGNGETEIVVAVLRRNLPAGRSMGLLTVRTDDPTRPWFRVVARVKAVAQIRASPAHLFLRAGDKREVLFLTSDGKYTRIVQAESEHPAIVAEVTERGLFLRVDDANVVPTQAVVVRVTTATQLKSRVLVSVVSSSSPQRTKGDIP